jgi:hypothetical protein
MTDEEEPTFGDRVQQANQFHSQLDMIKEWAHNNAASMEARADTLEDHDVDLEDEPSPDELREAASLMRTLYHRIELGDSNIVKQQ